MMRIAPVEDDWQMSEITGFAASNQGMELDEALFRDKEGNYFLYHCEQFTNGMRWRYIARLTNERLNNWLKEKGFNPDSVLNDT